MQLLRHASSLDIRQQKAFSTLEYSLNTPHCTVCQSILCYFRLKYSKSKRCPSTAVGYVRGLGCWTKASYFQSATRSLYVFYYCFHFILNCFLQMTQSRGICNFEKFSNTFEKWCYPSPHSSLLTETNFRLLQPLFRHHESPAQQFFQSTAYYIQIPNSKAPINNNSSP
ncbi:hypothetical protein BCR33DRAFT_528398 [Rhizoclosmatium globosum]|uniref:Uncharacterized protein n=1 Tax=Rhizoclosmatium globosum TaxID=329046 RepID=A0A1Y2CTK4_9FUNG|nr:hypothetical protein BCR33DRAFT_528398 [Rhizoclosmatium globosum]|eukprot:ORY50388.1 hypothetical protein BCR33DRAFT_528398 [Rhizoclosmatium globosum]